MKTLTVVNCCIFSLQSSDGHREVRAASTATKPRFCSWFKCAHMFYQELWRLSRFLLIPGRQWPIAIIGNSFTGESDGGSWSRCLDCRLSHSHLTAASCTQKQIIDFSAERKERKGSTWCLKCCWVNEPVKQQQASVQMRMVMRVMVLSADWQMWVLQCWTHRTINLLTGGSADHAKPPLYGNDFSALSTLKATWDTKPGGKLSGFTPSIIWMEEHIYIRSGDEDLSLCHCGWYDMSVCLTLTYIQRFTVDK